MYTEDIALPEQLVERDTLGSQFLFRFLVMAAVMIDDGHVKRTPATARQFHADASETEDAERLSPKLNTQIAHRIKKAPVAAQNFLVLMESFSCNTLHQ